MSTPTPVFSGIDPIVLEHLRPLMEHLRSSGGGSANGAERITGTLPQFAEQLFGRAPKEFLAKRTTEQLAEALLQCREVISSALHTTPAFGIKYQRYADRAVLMVSLEDRPFIINTIADIIREAGIDIRLFLHPILADGSRLLSLSYVELEPASQEVLASLAQEIDSSLHDLMLVTSDFSAMLTQTEALAQLLDSAAQEQAGEVPPREAAELLRWLIDGSFVFLGQAVFPLNSQRSGTTGPDSQLGIFKSSSLHIKGLLSDCSEDVEHLLAESRTILVSSLFFKSPVHHRTRALNISILERDVGGKPIAVHSTVGLLTSKARAAESSVVPLVRGKLQKLVDIERAHPNSYTFKKLRNFINNLPTGLALRLDTEMLLTAVRKTFDVHSRHATRVVTLSSTPLRAVSVLIVMPRDRFNPEVRRRMQRHIESRFGSPTGSSEYQLDISDKALARFYISVPLPSGSIPSIDLDVLARELARISKSWRDQLEERLADCGALRQAANVWQRYGDAFPATYQALQSVADAENDIVRIESMGPKESVRFALVGDYCAIGPETTFELVLYSRGKAVVLSHIMPVLENVGFEVLNEKSALVNPQGTESIYVHRFSVRSADSFPIVGERFDANLAAGLAAVLQDLAPNDPLNRLLKNTALTVEALGLLRAYSVLLSQMNKFATRHAIYSVLASNPGFATRFWEMFELRFNPIPALPLQERAARFTSLMSEYVTNLALISDIAQDRILRGIASLLEVTVRTNYYLGRSPIALKLHSEKADIVPQPRPKFEIFVSGPTVEGVHLRSSMVSRGGIRWSERRDDYRTEVLGLMKTQKVKNVVIVPSGAKGGFIVRKPPAESSELRAAVENCYRDFIGALLSICDNRIGGKIVPPRGLVIHDGEDPYFVVAADKGTASFSDVANGIAVKDYNFWLGDAFASGGSNGYDHKKYGITARGAWECVLRHFAEAGISPDKQTFTAVGIGDMSGDVFGNGLLLSDKFKLICAFDHRSIFLDPDPDPARSFAERTRLFQLKGSRWEDYDRSLISKGGGIFGRSAKEIRLSAEVRTALNISSDIPEVVNGEQLIHLALQAKVDLLWNGGIGTYVKSSGESHADVNDSSNDRVRINADQLRAAVVGEGGNLGFTQRGRIQYALKGGRLNTDAIDNSAGVDLSDHEVNLKILFAEEMHNGRLTVEERNQLLAAMADEVCDAVLEHNRQHARILTVAVQRSKRNIEYLRSFLVQMQKLGYLNRALEALPDDEELFERGLNQEGMVRPELAVCTAISKMWLKDTILGSKLPDEKPLEAVLFEYFPERLRSRFSGAISSHPLRRNIVATELANEIIDTTGITFIHRTCLIQSVRPEVAVAGAAAAMLVLGSEQLLADLRRFDNAEGNEVFLGLYQDLCRAVRACTSWMIASHGEQMDFPELIRRYRQPFAEVVRNAPQLFGGSAGEDLRARTAALQTQGLSKHSAQSFALFPLIIQALELIWVSESSHSAPEKVAPLYFAIISSLDIGEYVTLGRPIEAANKWENELRFNAYDEIRRSISHIACALYRRKCLEPSAIRDALTRTGRYEFLSGTLAEIREVRQSVAALAAVAKQMVLLQHEIVGEP